MIAPADRHLGKYEIRYKLGRGGMADVYLAQDTEQSCPVALKIIERAPDPDTRDSIEAERRGAVLQARLADIDPRVVRIFDAGDLDHYFYVAMEYIDGQDLAELMRRGRLEPEFAADVALGVAETLHNAHNLRVEIDGKEFHGIVHGDIKPKNIRIDAHGEVRVLDFGIAKALSLSRRLTRNEFGSVPYASPERLDTGDVNAQSDLWSLAVMLYEMVTGLQPYQADSTERLERMIRSRIPPPPPPDPCPEPLRRILIKAMEPEPELRYASAREFADDLAAYRKGGQVRAVTEDLEATRRTSRSVTPVDDDTRRTAPDTPPAPDDDTRRTTQPAGVRFGAPPPRNVPPPASQLPRRQVGFFAKAMRTMALLALGCMLYGGWEMFSSYRLYEQGQQLQREIETERLSDADQIWTKWTELSKGNSSSWLLHGPRKTVKQTFVSAADGIIANYRDSDSQPVTEKDWERARTLLSRALAVEPDNTVRGKLRLTEGHLARINGGAHRDAAQFRLAADDFNQAEHLLPNSPDPELGLARLYIYNLGDTDRGYEALQKAEQLGFHLGNREKLMLADGYRRRGDRLFWDSRNVRGLPQEKDQIQRAADDYRHALDLYQSIAPYGNSSSNVASVQASLDSVNTRLQEIAAKEGSTPAHL
jgi:tetratricopeptide (TPR) repeat protein/predicted Ser/Thr protein kinase